MTAFLNGVLKPFRRPAYNCSVPTSSGFPPCTKALSQGATVPASAPSPMSRSRRGSGRAALLVFAALAAGSSVGAAPAAAADQAPPGGDPVGDFNGDGFGDFAARRGAWPGTLVVAFGSAGAGIVALPGEGGTGVELDVDGTPARDYDPSAYFRLPTRIGDVDGDGKTDIAVVSNVNRSWIVYGGGEVGTIRVASPGPRVTALVHDYHHIGDPVVYGIGDFNGDGRGDFLQSRLPVISSVGTAGLPKVGAAVIVLGGPRVAELETRGAGDRRIQVDSNGKCTTRWVVIIPSTTCTWLWPGLEAIGDFDRDGKADLWQPTGSFVVKGRASTASFNGLRPDANTVAVPMKPVGDPWTPTPVVPPADPGSQGTDGWTLTGQAARQTDGSVNLTPSSFAGIAGAVYDASKVVDANEIVVDFDARLVDSGRGNGNGFTVAFASKAQGGAPRAANPGIGLGWVGNKGNAFTFGTVKGTYTPSSNYVGVAAGGVGKSGYPVFLQTFPAVSPLAGHINHITVRASGGTVTVQVNGVERLRRTMVLPPDAYVGFTAGTSAQRQDHIVENVVIKKP